MQELKGKIFYLSIIILMVVSLLFANFGQDFKDDIFYYNYAINHRDNLLNYWNKTSNYENYIDSSSKYIAKTFRDNNIKPLMKDGYFEEWLSNKPSFDTPSSLEIISDNEKNHKKYIYGLDFFEDFKGIISPGTIKSKFSYLKNINSANRKLPKIILFSGYHNKSQNEISAIDSKLKSMGVIGVISPSSSYDLKYSSGLYDSYKTSSENGLIKLVVSQNVFDDLKKQSSKGVKIRIKSGASIKPVKMRNIYGVLSGGNSSYKPLVIVTFYDGIYKTPDIKIDDFKKYVLSSSIIMDTMRCLKIQRLNKPDRPIVFAFLSGYVDSKEGIDVLMKNNFSGDFIVLEGFGISEGNILSYSKSSKYFVSNIELFVKKNNLTITSKNINEDLKNNFIYIITRDFYNPSSPDFQTVYKSGNFLLSIMGDECYNLDFLSGNIRELRIIKRFFKNNTFLISLATLILLIWVVFKPYKSSKH